MSRAGRDASTAEACDLAGIVETVVDISSFEWR
jgi:hypothetical protein